MADAEEMARDAVTTLLDVPQVAEAQRLRKQAEDRVRRALDRAVSELLSTGASQRDAARLLGMSHQRVSH